MEELFDETTQEDWTPSMPELQLELELKIRPELETSLRSVQASAGLN
jgi:hypothetical protein